MGDLYQAFGCDCSDGVPELLEFTSDGPFRPPAQVDEEVLHFDGTACFAQTEYKIPLTSFESIYSLTLTFDSLWDFVFQFDSVNLVSLVGDDVSIVRNMDEVREVAEGNYCPRRVEGVCRGVEIVCCMTPRHQIRVVGGDRENVGEVLELYSGTVKE